MSRSVYLKFYKLVKPLVKYGSKTWTWDDRNERIEEAEMRTLRYINYWGGGGGFTYSY
jgi:hypothetical protein